MCGIFAVSGANNNGGAIVLNGLQKLEYRGYDSWGIATRTNSGAITTKKDIGKISEVTCSFDASSESIGHTRWATHGGVTSENAHPHTYGEVTLVHNGIFENYQAVKKQFPKNSFQSETDSEVIAALIDSYRKKQYSPEDSIVKACQEIAGRFSILVLFDGVDGIFAARRGSPLIIGKGETETFIASDIPAFLHATRTVNYLDDNEMVHVNGTDLVFMDLQTKDPKEKRDITVEWDIEQAEKGDYDHFMLKEIFEQKESIARAINHEDEQIIEAIRMLQSCNGAYFVACGTAHKAALAAEYFFAEVSGRKINVVQASEMISFERFVNDKTAIVTVSQSGETADVLEVLERAKAKKAKIIALTNVQSSSIARIADVHLPINAGVEKAVASTKATTAQMALLLLLAYADNRNTNAGREVLRSASANINEMINPRYEKHIEEIAKKVVEHNTMFIIGRGSLYPMALEAAIKIQEVSYIHAQGFAAGELKHGPIALIEKGTPCVVLGDDQETISNAMELKSRGAYIIGISCGKNDVFDDWIKVTDCREAQAIATIVPIQIFAYHLAVLRGLDPDMPRNLAKSVTVK